MLWKPVKNYEGLYEINAMGRVRSLKRIAKVARQNRRNYQGKYLVSHLSPRLIGTAHGCEAFQVQLSRDGRTIKTSVDSLMMDAFPEIVARQAEIIAMLTRQVNGLFDGPIYLSAASMRKVARALVAAMNRARTGL